MSQQRASIFIYLVVSAVFASARLGSPDCSFFRFGYINYFYTISFHNI